MRIDFNIAQSERGNFITACEAAIRNVGAGTKAATEYAGWDIMSDSLDQVPIDTGTLVSSAFLGVSSRTDVKSYKYGAILGYGDISGLATQVDFGPVDWLMEPTNGINPKSGLPASAYAAVVHEDLSMPHPNGGKAKFLEDPIRNWAAGKFARTAMTYWKRAISYSDASRAMMSYRYSTGTRKLTFTKFKPPKIRHVAFTKQGSGVQRGGTYVYKGENR